MDNKIRVAVVGVGFIGKIHALEFKNAGADVITLCDIVRER